MLARRGGRRDNQQKADQYFAEGRERLTKKQDAKGACEKFELAIQLDPTAPVAGAEAKGSDLSGYEEEAKTHTKTLAHVVGLRSVRISGGGASRCASPSRAPARS